MKPKNRAFTLLLVVVLCAIGLYSYISYVSGTRFTPLAAAKAQPSIGENATVFGQVDMPWGKVYLFHTSQGDRTAVVHKQGQLLWFCNTVATMYPQKETDPVQMVGLLNYQNTGVNPPESIALIAVVSNDPNVKKIAVGPGADRVEKPIELAKPLLIWWPKSFIGSLKPVALSEDGKPLYEYRFDKANVADTKTLKWYPVQK